MRTFAAAALALITCVATTLRLDASDGPSVRTKGWIWEVQPVQGRLVVRVEERRASFARTFHVRPDTAIVSYTASERDGASSLPVIIVLGELRAGDEIVVIHRLENGRHVAGFIEKRR